MKARYGLLPICGISVLALGWLGCKRSSNGSRHVSHVATTVVADPSLSASAAAQIARLLTGVERGVTVQDEMVRFEGHTMAVHVTRGPVMEEKDRVAAFIDVTVDIDGRPMDVFRTTSVGVGTDRAGALERAVREWVMGSAVPIVDAIRAGSLDRDGGAIATALRVGPFWAFPGPTGVQGQAPRSWQAGFDFRDLHRALLGRIEPGLDELIPPAQRTGYHTFKVLFHVRDGVVTHGECHVDGVASQRLCEYARGFTWPPDRGEYLFRQYYVLVRDGRSSRTSREDGATRL